MKGLEKSLSLYPEDMEVRLLLGRLYLSRSQRARSRRGFSEAVSNLEKFLDIYPQDLPSRLELAALYHQQKKGEKALEHYKFAFKQKPHRWDICLKIAALLDERGLLIEAESFFRQAVRIDTTSALPHLGLGMFYLKRGHPGKAREALKQALQQDPSNAYARQLLRETEE
jgi:Tfp pilus assembly protein PilF